MSRIGKQPIPVPAGVEVSIKDNTITVKGGNGELSYEFNPIMTVAHEGEEIIVTRPDDSREARSFLLSHLRVPATSLVTKVYTSLKKLFH